MTINSLLISILDLRNWRRVSTIRCIDPGAELRILRGGHGRNSSRGVPGPRKGKYVGIEKASPWGIEKASLWEFSY